MANVLEAIGGKHFTFQYGSTLIRLIVVEEISSYNFTFQYGSTLIIRAINANKEVLDFTFQYGSTLIIFVRVSTSQPVSSLHSNMVLL